MLPKNAPLKKPFEVVELGMGKRPVGLLQKAAMSAKTKKHRSFVGVDIRRVNLDAVLKKAKLQRTPKNLSLLRNCAIEALEAMAPQSKQVIFASFLANNLAWQLHKVGKKVMRKDTALILAAKRVLVPGG